MRQETNKVFRKIQRRLQLKTTIGMAYDNIRGLFAIPGVFFNVDIGGWGFSERKITSASTIDERYIHIARNRIRRVIKSKPSYEDLSEFVKIFIGGMVSMLHTQEGSVAYVITPSGILWLDRPPVAAIDPDHSGQLYRTIMNSVQPFYKQACRLYYNP